MKLAHINLAKGFRGGERQTANLIEELEKEGFKQTLFVREDSPEPSLESYLKDLNNLEIIKLSKPYFHQIKKLSSFQLIHSHEAKANQVVAFANLLFGTPYVVTRRVQFTPSQNFINRYIYKKALKVVALSSAIRRDLQELDKRLEIDTIPSSYTEDIPEIVRDVKERYRDKFLVGHVGAVVDSHKGQCTILESAKLLQKSHPHIHFLLVGDGKDIEFCRARARYFENIEFIGFRENVFDYIRAFDLFLFPSKHEGLGSTLLDVMRLRVPIVASNVGGIVDIIRDGESGYLIQPENPLVLRDKIVELVESEYLREKFIDGGLSEIGRFSPRSMMESYLEIYKSSLVDGEKV
jgi:glycosyltransferase involved in cell wall biosynthesis